MPNSKGVPTEATEGPDSSNDASAVDSVSIGLAVLSVVVGADIPCSTAPPTDAKEEMGRAVNNNPAVNAVNILFFCA
ncbi:hypothetical protein [Cohnella rhizosphaerae]|uniref:Uncharacterized protein n=1 Tax=Cohnella rhizosphaerae TaxID=1457232 RepID=A0A9X4QTM0_9BACL|nr:hypothetical protein [Cohnella rhizosphaerae]MDG0810554.1 hypothetical protein [Cohnella rhizosphaerae]